MASVARSRAEDLGRRLLEADETATAIAPLSEAHPDLTIEDAYAIQSAGRAARLGGGARLVGHKVGLTSTAMQEMVGVDQPDFGYLTDAMVLPDGAMVDLRELVSPRVEGEIAMRLGARLFAADVTAQEVFDATDSVAPALEVIDSRIADWRITIVDTIADNASSARAIVGDWVDPRHLDLAAVTMRMRVGETRLDGRGDAVLGHPAESVAWLARTLYAQGEALEAGETVLSGALARAVAVGHGTRARATFDGVGSVSVGFGGDRS